MKLPRGGLSSAPGLALLLAALALARLAAMVLLPLMDTTEARYGEIGRKMAELGDWITPWHAEGVPFWGKPPLSFWLTAGSFRLLGVNELAARLPHFLCAALIAALAWDLGRRRDARTAWLALAVLVGSVLFWVSAGAVMTDGALVLGTTLCLHAFWLALHAPEDAIRTRAGWLFFVGLALGLLAKGPLALVLAGAPLLLWTALMRRWRRVWQSLPWLRGAVLTLVLALPWYGLAERRTPGFLAYFIMGEHWHRFVTPGWQGDLYGTAHRYAPGTIWLFAAAALLPWTLLLPLAAWRGRGQPVQSRAADAREWDAYLLLWALVPLLFFTPARNIIWTYPLPALPAVALLIAGWWVRQPLRAERWAAAGLVISLGLALAGGIAGRASGAIEAASARPVVRAYEALHPSGQPLIFVGGRAFSAAFYSRNQARHVERAADIPPALASAGAFVAVRADALDTLRAVGFDVSRIEGRFGDVVLVQLSAGPAPQPGVAP
ncbi:glycosyltransferase family 39 protein [uncultured Azohydromonas sp.]|uniref:ArnT family glycosyltransferase n=1 Tax=uncultured Azohydromonas sp. TaxID=487342 RepID=UPI00260B0D67|nr:glycosyltransferase family 39 protein [uncultured Azohydromonas sp.]